MFPQVQPAGLRRPEGLDGARPCRAGQRPAGRLDPYLDRQDARHTILIDTCLGNHKQRTNPGWSNLDTPFLERLKACGCPAELVDFVMCTHLHVDHVGWNTKLENGRWVPTFPNAKYLFAKREYAHWESERNKQGDGKVNDGSFDDSVLPVRRGRQGGDDRQRSPARPAAHHQGLSRPHAGLDRHQPQGRRQAGDCFSGDIMHHPIQVYHPDWSSQFCSDQDLSARSRRQLLEDCAESNALLCPAHFPRRQCGLHQAAGDAFRIDWDR